MPIKLWIEVFDNIIAFNIHEESTSIIPKLLINLSLLDELLDIFSSDMAFVLSIKTSESRVRFKLL